jgi:peptide deformylase
MAKLNIVEVGNDPKGVLSRKAVNVAESAVFDGHQPCIRHELVANMVETMGDNWGLAAPQVGVSLRLFVVNGSLARKGRPLVFINPELTQGSATFKSDEGCLSILDEDGNPKSFQVERPREIRITFTDANGARRTLGMRDLRLLARKGKEGLRNLIRTICHEYDHLDGVLAGGLRRSSGENLWEECE